MSTYKVGEQMLSLSVISEIIEEDKQLTLGEKAKQKIQDCRDYLDKKMEQSDAPIYGINTGFGSLCNHKISNADLGQLQTNLVLSHSCGTGDKVPADVVKIMLLLKVQSLSYGHSGVQLKTVEFLIEMFNKNILPVLFLQTLWQFLTHVLLVPPLLFLPNPVLTWCQFVVFFLILLLNRFLALE